MDQQESTSEPAEPRPRCSIGSCSIGNGLSVHEPTHTGAAIELADTGRLLSQSQHTELSHLCARALAVLQTTGSVRAKIVADAEMAAAHEAYAKVPGTTDVLTFDMRDDDATDQARLDVDLLVCIDEARRQSAQRNHPITHELLLYIVHGVLHCLGFGDHTDEDAQAIHAEEDRVLTSIGIGRVYDAKTEGVGA